MNRTIVTPGDARAARLRVARARDEREIEDLLTEEKGAAGPTADGGTGVSQPSQQIDSDSWYERLLKYIPAEAVALYLALDGIIRSTSLSRSQLRIWLGLALGLALVVSMAFTWLYLQRIARVNKQMQLAVSTAALVVYVFALGGVFATFAFYHPWQGTALLVVATAFVALYVPPDAVAPTPVS